MSALRPALIALASLAALPSCSRCGGGHGPAPLPDTDDPPAAEPSPQEGERRLPKHDWNGVAVMMHEEEARGALDAIGFDVVPSRTTSFPVLDPVRRTMDLRPAVKLQPSIVAMETSKRKGECKLGAVYGVKLWFHSNRLYAFQPVYHADPVDLVEPGDEAVTPEEMEKRLSGTFGPPGWTQETAGDGKTTVWSDDDLTIVYHLSAAAGPPSYHITFISPKGNEAVARKAGLTPG